MANAPLTDFELISAWHDASQIFDDASHTLTSVEIDLATTAACQKVMIAATVKLVELGKEASTRKLILTRRTSG